MEELFLHELRVAVLIHISNSKDKRDIQRVKNLSPSNSPLLSAREKNAEVLWHYIHREWQNKRQKMEVLHIALQSAQFLILPLLVFEFFVLLHQVHRAHTEEQKEQKRESQYLKKEYQYARQRESRYSEVRLLIIQTRFLQGLHFEP